MRQCFTICYDRLTFTSALFKKKNFREFYVYVYACMNVCYCDAPEPVGALQRLVSERPVPLLPIHSLPAIATIIVSYFLLFIYVYCVSFNCYALMKWLDM